MTNHQTASAGQIVVFTDGSCLTNPGPMGWAFLIQWPDGQTFEKASAALDGTNNMAELLAAINALKAIPEGSEIKIMTDSDYLRLGATQWLPKWLDNNWKNAQRKPVKNKKHWKELSELMEAREVIIGRVAAHSGDPSKDRVDELARSAAEGLGLGAKNER